MEQQEDSTLEGRPAAPTGSRPSPTPPGDDTILAQGPAEVRLAQELRLHRIELEAQHEELRSTQDELEVSRDRFADLYELSPVAFFTTTAAGVVLELNGAAAWLLERPRAVAVGVPLAHMAGFAATLLQAHLGACLTASEPVTVEVDLVPPSGRRCRVQLTSRSVQGPGGERLCLIAVTDVSTHRRVEERLRIRADAGAALLAAATQSEVVEPLTRALVPAVADLCVLDLVMPPGELRRGIGVCHADPARGERFVAAERRWGVLPNVGYATLQALQTGRSQLIPTITPKYLETAAVDDAHLTELVGLALRSWAVVPLLDPAEGRPMGVLRLGSAGVRRPLAAEDLALADELARLGARALAGIAARAARAEQALGLVRAVEETLHGLGPAALARARAALAELEASLGQAGR